MTKALIFDSGVGGLSVVRELRLRLPDLHLTYAADDEFRPYGDKTELQLQARLPGLLQTLVLAAQPDIVVLACNTASTTALAAIRNSVAIPVIGVVPAIKPAALMSKNKAIAVLGTPGTVRRKYVDALITDFASECRVVLHGSTQLVELAERKLAGQSVDMQDVHREIMPIFSRGGGKAIDTIVLACTHFPLLIEELKQAAPHDINWIDSGRAIAQRAQSILDELPLSSKSKVPQTALLIGGAANAARAHMFKSYGFEKTVVL